MAATKRIKQAGAVRRPISGSKTAFARRTITIPRAMEAAIESLVGQGKFSAFAQEAFAHEIQRESIARWLDERDAKRKGKPLGADAIAFAEAAWRNRE